MADLFEAYEEEFNDLRAQIEQRTRSLPSLESGKFIYFIYVAAFYCYFDNINF